MRYLLLVLLLGGCCTTEHGGLTIGMSFASADIKCDFGKPYYEDVTISTSFETMIQEVEITWQCLEVKQPHGTARHYMKIKKYHLSMEDAGEDLNPDTTP